MSNIQTGAERMANELSHVGFLAFKKKRLITISTTPVIAGDSFEMDAVGALRLSPLRRGLAIDSTVDIFTFYVPHRHVYGEQWIKFMKDGVNATPLFFSSRRRHTRFDCDWSSDVCSSDLVHHRAEQAEDRRRGADGEPGASQDRNRRHVLAGERAQQKPGRAGNDVDDDGPRRTEEIGRASCRERV